jgi:UrcA family protein
MKNRKFPLGSMIAGTFAATLLCGAAMAQDYSDSTAGPRPENSYPGNGYYDTAPGETIIVRPYRRIEKRQLVGRINGEIDPVELSISQPVSFSDLDLTRNAGVEELHARILDTARGLCAELERQDANLRDTDGNRECVRTATENAMNDALYRRG